MNPRASGLSDDTFLECNPKLVAMRKSLGDVASSGNDRGRILREKEALAPLSEYSADVEDDCRIPR